MSKRENKMTTIVVRSGRAQDGDKTFKRYSYYTGPAFRLVDEILKGNDVKMSAIGANASQEMLKAIVAGKKILLESGFEITESIETEKIKRKGEGKDDNYTMTAYVVIIKGSKGN